MSAAKRKTITERVRSCDLADHLCGSLKEAIWFLEKTHEEHPGWMIGCENDYDGYTLYFYNRRPENDVEFAARKAEERVIREAKKANQVREAKRKEKRAEIKRLQSELSRL